MLAAAYPPVATSDETGAGRPAAANLTIARAKKSTEKLPEPGLDGHIATVWLSFGDVLSALLEFSVSWVARLDFVRPLFPSSLPKQPLIGIQLKYHRNYCSYCTNYIAILYLINK